jgi:hypothetical protein
MPHAPALTVPLPLARSVLVSRLLGVFGKTSHVPKSDDAQMPPDLSESPREHAGRARTAQNCGAVLLQAVESPFVKTFIAPWIKFASWLLLAVPVCALFVAACSLAATSQVESPLPVIAGTVGGETGGVGVELIEWTRGES